MMEKLGCVIYVSLVRKGFSNPEVEKMLKDAREARELLNISGVTIFSNGMILTLIEGEVNKVNAYFISVTEHIGLNNVIKLLDRAILHRSFEDYSLAFKPYDKNLQALDDFKDLKGQRYFEQFLSNNNVISNMVKGFINGKIS
ncbi:MAG: hypothetical protein JWN56_495 [Sphingobacteriales bacterium]|nr:hypothetical protein [Sphingobacteriales bacterium]